MVLLTMTQTMVEALQKLPLSFLEEQSGVESESNHDANAVDESKTTLKSQLEEDDSENLKSNTEPQSSSISQSNDTSSISPSKPTTTTHNKPNTSSIPTTSTQPSLLDPKIGDPISHTQLIALSTTLKAHSHTPYNLSTLLYLTKPYIPPPPPPPKKSPSYIALMRSLRLAEEERAYAAMTSTAPLSNKNHIPPTQASPFDISSTSATKEDTAKLISETNEQISLIANVLLSMICCGAAIWMVAKWWNTPARLALSMGGGVVVGIAEVGVYWGYLRRVEVAQKKAGREKEKRSLGRVWEVGGKGLEGKKEDVLQDDGMRDTGVGDEKGKGVRRRKKG